MCGVEDGEVALQAEAGQQKNPTIEVYLRERKKEKTKEKEDRKRKCGRARK